MRHATKRIAAGSYEVTARGYVVEVKHRADLSGWIARATWSRWTYSDPIATLRAAKVSALAMIDDALKADRARASQATTKGVRL